MTADYRYMFTNFASDADPCDTPCQCIYGTRSICLASIFRHFELNYMSTVHIKPGTVKVQNHDAWVGIRAVPRYPSDIQNAKKQY